MTEKANRMHLTLMTPTAILVDREVSKVITEAPDGSFCLLPRHCDFVASLIPGILSLCDADGSETLYAINHGALIKAGRHVRISTWEAIAGEDIDDLQETVARRFEQLNEQERSARSALARLEAGTIRRFAELEEHLRG